MEKILTWLNNAVFERFDEESLLFLVRISLAMLPVWGFITTLALIKEIFFK